MIQRALAADLRATVEVGFPREGFHCLIDGTLPGAPA